MVFASCFVGDFRGGEMGGICAKNPLFSARSCSAKRPEMLGFSVIWSVKV